MRQLFLSLLVSAAVIATLASQAQTPQTPPPPTQKPATPNRRPVCHQPRRRHAILSAGVPSRQGQQRAGTAPAGAANQAPFDPATWKYGTAFNPPAGREDLESRQAQDDAGRQSDRRHALLRDRSVHLLRDGQRRLRLHLDRDAAWPARLGSGGADVAHVSRRRRRSPACASRTPTNARFSMRSTAGALVVVVPTVDTVEEAIEARNWTYFPPLGRRSNGGGQAFDAAMWGGCRAATATPSTTTSC